MMYNVLMINSRRGEKVRKRYEILFAVILLGLGVFYVYPSTPKEKYDKYYALWKSHGIENYAYTLIGFSSSFGPEVLRIIVNDNKIINIYKLDKAKEKIDKVFPAYTIEDKFNDIAVNSLERRVAIYDKTYGYPKYNKSLYSPEQNSLGHIMLGVGYNYQIENFRVLPKSNSNKYQPVCAKIIIIDPCMSMPCSALRWYNKTYQNKDFMDMDGAYFNHEGKCEDDENKK